ncbi:c-type cytochrome [Teredinibacter turnerae]|uniref:c-type cytochrome n=1 Tax=Teredinibacter turnerae TaxID=2426 RepID=UPI000376679D|nr:cytochrome c5 family protein [Teredinibacter turnerae]
MNMKLSTLALAGVLAAFSLAVSAESLEERIQPVGKTCMAGDECAAAVQVADAGGSASRSGEEIYQKCSACHATGAAGAPKFGDKDAWVPRIAKGDETLYTHAINGFNGMPAKGLCFDCSDDEIKAAVDYMTSNSQ